MPVDYTKLLNGNSLLAIKSYLQSNYQPLNSNLTSIAALATNVTGLVKITNGVASLDGTSYAPLASPTFTGTVTLPTSVKIGTSTETGLVKYTNGVLSIDTNTYLTSHRYRPIKVNGTQQLANTSSTALDFVNPASGYNVVFTWDSTANGVKANVDLSGYIPTTDKGAANGVASLGSDGKVPTSQLPDSIVGSMEYKGTFDATSGSTISGLEQGWYYICAMAGSNNPDGTTGPTGGYSVGDWAVYNGSSAGWAKIDNEGKVTSVNGQTGAVTVPVASLTTTSGFEKVTVDNVDLDVMTRTTAQTINANKTFINRNGIFFGTESATDVGTYIHIGITGSSTTTILHENLILNIEPFLNSNYGTISLEDVYYSSTSNKKHLSILSDGKFHLYKNVITTDSSDSYLQFPAGKGSRSGTSLNPTYTYATLATVDDISTAVGNCYTEQEALDILNGTAS